MPTTTLNDEDLKKFFQSKGYNAKVIISKKIDENGNIQVIWKPI